MKLFSATAKQRLWTISIIFGAELALLLAAVLFLPLRRWAMRQAIPTDYFEVESRKGDLFEQVGNRVYAFRHGIDRTLIIDSGDGLAVIDPFSTEFATALRGELAKRFPGARVRWVVYSHNHLDHIRGGGVLQPEEVIAHAKVWSYVVDWPHDDVLKPTRTLEGDQELRFGPVVVRALYLGHSHTDTLYAFFIPSERLVFAPDTAFVHAFPPFGLPDWYYPGYMRALDRIAELDFDSCVPSHFDRGTKQDFLAYRQMMRDYRSVAAAAVAKRGGVPASGAMVRDVFDEAYPALKAKYGDWLGFDSMFVPHFIGSVGGNYLGY